MVFYTKDSYCFDILIGRKCQNSGLINDHTRLVWSIYLLMWVWSWTNMYIIDVVGYATNNCTSLWPTSICSWQFLRARFVERLTRPRKWILYTQTGVNESWHLRELPQNWNVVADNGHDQKIPRQVLAESRCMLIRISSGSPRSMCFDALSCSGAKMRSLPMLCMYFGMDWNC
jgi:hypothetical protein